MIKKIIIGIASLAIMSSSLCGCNDKKNKTTVISNSAVGDTQTNGFPDDCEIDLDLCAKNVTEIFMGKDSIYPKMDFSITVPSKNDDFFNIIIVADEKPADENQYVEWLKVCLSELNSQAIKQDPRIKGASDGYYGGLFDRYRVTLTATCLNEIISVWVVNQTIEPGAHDAIVTNHDKIELNQFE